MVKGFERYGLSGNPFHDLASENIDDIEIFHVQQDIDYELDSIQEDVIDLENHSVIFVLGGLGAGKTERLQVALNRTEKEGIFSIYNSVTPDTKWVLQEIISSLIEKSDIGVLGGLSGPSWYKDLVKINKSIEKKGYHPDNAGKAIAGALNDNKPSFLLLNDLHHIKRSKIKKFMESLYVIFNNIDDGVMIMMGSDLRFYSLVTKKFPSIKQRINNIYEIPPLDEDEASLLLAKRMLAKRLVEDLNPIYPFTDEAIYNLNKGVNGNPRKLLKFSDKVLDFAADQKAINIDKQMISTVAKIEREKRKTRKQKLKNGRKQRNKKRASSKKKNTQTKSKSSIKSKKKKSKSKKSSKDKSNKRLLIKRKR